MMSNPTNIKSEMSEISCYIHGVSPAVKKSGATSYFNCSLQTETNIVKGVCFSMEKKETLTAVAAQKSPVKIKKYSLNNKYGREDVVINRYTTITPTDVGFSYKSVDDVTSIASLSHVAPEQLVGIKGYVAHLDSTKTIVLQSSPVKKQEGYISDPTGFIKVIFWGKHADTVAVGSTYFFNKLRVKQSQNQRYLNTPKQEDECTIKATEVFTEPLPTVDAVSMVKEVTGSILGVSNLSKYSCCCSCSKKVTIKGHLAFCPYCRLSQKTAKCSVQWHMKIYMQISTTPTKNIYLSMNNEAVNKLFTICQIAEDSTDDEIIESILILDDVLVSYDSQTNKMIDIETISI